MCEVIVDGLDPALTDMSFVENLIYVFTKGTLATTRWRVHGHEFIAVCQHPGQEKWEVTPELKPGELLGLEEGTKIVAVRADRWPHSYKI